MEAHFPELYLCKKPSMIEIEGKIVSREIFERHFVCNLQACKGICCVKGDSGAPLSEEETEILSQNHTSILPFLAEDGKQAIQSLGTHVMDVDGESVTPLVDGKHCAYTVFDEGGTAHCGIENAWKAGATAFRKPVSCHLYPIRIQTFDQFEAINYDEWDICDPACSLGKELQVPVYKFLKEALIRKYGEDWYTQLSIAATWWMDKKK
jgi:hypothetical protein